MRFVRRIGAALISALQISVQDRGLVVRRLDAARISVLQISVHIVGRELAAN